MVFRSARAVYLALLVARVMANEKKNRKITVTNQCTFTVWPGLFTSVGPQPKQATGWESPPGSTLTFEVEESWGGRVWPRTGCDFSDTSKPDYAQCETGGCKGGLQCDPSAGTGVLPVTLAEFNIQTDIDHYDTSNVDGYNVGLAITNTADCPQSNCPYNLMSSCPDDLKYKNDAGEVVGCLTACGKWQTNEEYCCTGAHNLAATCPPSGVKYYDWWKKGCPIAYAYAYDESSGTALFTCTKQVDWIITFCPDSSLFATTATLPNGTEVSQGGDGYELFSTAAVSVTLSTRATVGGGGEAAATQASSAGGKEGGSATSTTPAATAAPTSPTGGPASAGTSKTPQPAATKPASSGSSSGSTAGSSGASGSGVSGSGASNSGASGSSTASADDKLFGLPKMAVYAIVALVVLLLIGAIAYYFFSSKKKDKKERHKATDDSSASDDDKSSTSSSSSGSDDEKPRKRRRSDEDCSLPKLDALGRAERRAVDHSIYAAAARDPAGLSGVLAREEAMRAPRTTFELAKGGAMSSSEESDAGEGLLRRSQRGRQGYEDGVF